MKRTISKVLSPNDAGETGAHQAGLLIPKEERLLSFFPRLDASIPNPRVHLVFRDQTGVPWEFAFIYYNKQLFGGTRNEYRLTRMTRYIREASLASGDEVQLHRDDDGGYSVSYRRENQPEPVQSSVGKTVIRLGKGWKVINI